MQKGNQNLREYALNAVSDLVQGSQNNKIADINLVTIATAGLEAFGATYTNALSLS